MKPHDEPACYTQHAGKKKRLCVCVKTAMSRRDSRVMSGGGSRVMSGGDSRVMRGDSST